MGAKLYLCGTGIKLRYPGEGRKGRVGLLGDLEQSFMVDYINIIQSAQITQSQFDEVVTRNIHIGSVEWFYNGNE